MFDTKDNFCNVQYGWESESLANFNEFNELLSTQKMTLRQRFSKDPLKVVRQLDAFPKVPEEYQQSTRIGGTRKHIELLSDEYFW